MQDAWASSSKEYVAMFRLKYFRFFGAEYITRHSNFGSVPDNFILDDFFCKGTENSLFECRFNTKDNCGTHQGAGVVCTGKNIGSILKLQVCVLGWAVLRPL